MLNSSILPIHRTLSGATITTNSGAGSDGCEVVLQTSQSFSITGASPSDCLVLYQGQSLGCLPPLERYSRCILHPQLTRPNDTRWGVFPLCRDAVGVFYDPSRLGCGFYWGFLILYFMVWYVIFKHFSELFGRR